MKTILIIDDDQDVADIVKTTVEAGIQGVSCKIEVDFSKSADRIVEVQPDAIVLDLMRGQKLTDLPGQQTWKFVWDETFCPIVIYTGSEAELQPPIPVNHPFVKRIPKGRDSATKVVEALKGFTPAVESVQKLRDEIEAVIHNVLRDTVGEGHLPMQENTQLLHAGRRRIAATMDERTLKDNRKMACWEHYLVPAIGKDCLTGDILHKHGAPRTPENYRLMLSPSCDLARGGKIVGALVAKCHAPTVMLDKFTNAINPPDEKDLKRQLTSLVLSQGAWNGWFPLPAFAETIPEMVAYLKDVEVIPLDAVHSEDATKIVFDRMASIDSPFREQVAWAFLTTAARPGMPDRDLKPWAEALVKSATCAVSPAQKSPKA